jgi:hypothetical protein
MEDAMTALVLERHHPQLLQGHHPQLVVHEAAAGWEGNEFCLPRRRVGL